MYVLKLKHHFDSAHKLYLSYESLCQNIHGHRWEIIINIQAEELNKDGMIIDFKKLKSIINNLDHCYLNDKLNFNTTAENMAKYLYDEIKSIDERFKKIKIELFESPEASIVYRE